MPVIGFLVAGAPPPEKNIGRISQRSLTLVTSRRERKRANTHIDWSHLALRKPATSRAIAGSYGGHSAGYGANITRPRLAAGASASCPLLPSNQVRQFLGREPEGRR